MDQSGVLTFDRVNSAAKLLEVEIQTPIGTLAGDDVMNSHTLFRRAGIDDAETLARMNHQLIRDEGHRNPMDVIQLTDRVRQWLNGGYSAVLFESQQTAIGYALFRQEPDYVYLRQSFVRPEYRRQGIGRNAIHWLWQSAWSDTNRLRIDVLVGNTIGREFWASVGFRDYCITMEAEKPNIDESSSPPV